MKLFTLLYGKSKTRMYPIMTDEYHKCKNYKIARESSGVNGWHDIIPAEPNAVAWRQKSATIGGNKRDIPRVGKNKGTTSINGYISKHGFQPHT